MNETVVVKVNTLITRFAMTRRAWLAAFFAIPLLILAGGNPSQARGQTIALGAGQGVDSAGGQPGSGTNQIFFPRVKHDRLRSSFDLIEQAEQRGEISDEMALLYRVFAVFADPRLPWRLRGDNTGVIDWPVVDEALRRFDTLTPATQATLAPFLVPPVYQGSWYDLRRRGLTGAAIAANQPVAPMRRQDLIDDLCQKVSTEAFLTKSSTHFMVWYPPNDPALAQDAQTALDQLEQRIYPTMTGLFNVRPKTDHHLGCNPGDARLDVYIVYGAFPSEYKGALAAVSPYPTEDCKDAASYMLVLAREYESLSVIVHEFTHMLQIAYKLTGPWGDCLGDNEDFWMEATADWAMDAFEELDPAPDRDFEHVSAPDYLYSAAQSLWEWGDNRQYGAYLLPFYLVRRLEPDRPQLIPDIFADMTQPGGESLFKVIDARVDGGLAERWPEFALYNLNLPPNNQYEQWDDLTWRWDDWKEYVAPRAEMEMKGGPQLQLVVTSRGSSNFYVRNMATEQMDIHLAPDVRMFAFANTFAGAPDTADIRVQALGKPNGGEWQGPFDWTPRKWNIICRDRTGQRFDDVIILLTNSNWKDPDSLFEVGDGPLGLVASNLGCARWQGTSEWREQGESHDDRGQLTYTLSATAQVTFDVTNSRVAGDAIMFEFQPVAASVSWSHVIDAFDLQTGQTAHCERGGVKSLADITSMLAVGEKLSGEALDRQFFVLGVAHLNQAELCPDTAEMGWGNQAWIQLGDDLGPWNGDDGGRLQGSFSETVTGDGFSHTETSSWDFTAG